MLALKSGTGGTVTLIKSSAIFVTEVLFPVAVREKVYRPEAVKV